MENREFISFIFTTYNSAAYVRRSLDSTLAAMDADSELVCVDDGSTDNTVKILREYENRDPRIIVIEQEHANCSAARKTGVENSTGDFIFFMDSDDLLNKNMLTEARELLSENTDILVTNVSERMLGGTSRLIYNGHQRIVDKNEYLLYLLGRDADYMLHGKFFRRSLFDIYHWDTDEVMKGTFHRALLLQLVCAATQNIVIVPSLISYFYIRRPGSLSAMLSLRTDGVAHLWQSLKLLPLPRTEFIIWALDLIDKMLLSRGLPIDDDFKPAHDLIEIAQEMSLPDESRHIIKLLADPKFRIKEARRLVREGNLTVLAPHLSFIVTAYNNAAEVKRTVESIFDTGFRNIEIIIVDDGSSHSEGVKINAYALRHPRIHQHKNATHKGTMASRLAGLQLAKGYAVTWINAGDTVEPEGIIEALDLIDRGADVAIYGATIKPGIENIAAESFRTTCITAARVAGSQKTADLLDESTAPYALCFSIAKTSFMRHVPMICTPNDYGARDQWHLSILEAKPKVEATRSIAYHMLYSMHKRTSSIKRVRGELSLGFRILNILAKHNLLDNDEVRESAATDMKGSLLRILSYESSRPLFGARHAKRLANQIVTLDDYHKFHTTLGVTAPSAKELLAAL